MPSPPRSIGEYSQANTHASSSFATKTERIGIPFKNGLETPDPYDADANTSIEGRIKKAHPNPYTPTKEPRLTPIKSDTPPVGLYNDAVHKSKSTVDMKDKTPRLWDPRTDAPGVGKYSPDPHGHVAGSPFGKDHLPATDLPFKAPKTPGAYDYKQGATGDGLHNPYDHDKNGPRLAPVKSDSPGVGKYNPDLTASKSNVAPCMKSNGPRLFPVGTDAPGVGKYSPDKKGHLTGSPFGKSHSKATDLPFRDGGLTPGPYVDGNTPKKAGPVDGSFKSNTPRLSPPTKANPDGTPKKLEGGEAHKFSKSPRFGKAVEPGRFG